MSFDISESHLKEIRENPGDALYLPLLSETGVDVIGHIELCAGMSGTVFINNAVIPRTALFLQVIDSPSGDENLISVNCQQKVTKIFEKLTNGLTTITTSISVTNSSRVRIASPTLCKNFFKKCLLTIPSKTPYIQYPTAVPVNKVISIGLDCLPSQAIRLSGQSSGGTNPLDWLRTSDLRTLIPLLENFDDIVSRGKTPFKEFKYLKWIRDNEFSTSTEEQKHIYDASYSVISSHHGDDDAGDQFDRRWSRLLSNLKLYSESRKPLVFVMTGRQPSCPLTIDDEVFEESHSIALKEFISAIEKCFPGLNFAVVAFNIPDIGYLHLCHYYNVGWCSTQENLLVDVLSELLSVETDD